MDLFFSVPAKWKLPGCAPRAGPCEHGGVGVPQAVPRWSVPGLHRGTHVPLRGSTVGSPEGRASGRMDRPWVSPGGEGSVCEAPSGGGCAGLALSNSVKTCRLPPL